MTIIFLFRNPVEHLADEGAVSPVLFDLAEGGDDGGAVFAVQDSEGVVLHVAVIGFDGRQEVEVAVILSLEHD